VTMVWGPGHFFFQDVTSMSHGIIGIVRKLEIRPDLACAIIITSRKMVLDKVEPLSLYIVVLLF